MIKYLSLFSGIGAFEQALTNIGVEFELVNYCEIDKYASKSYAAIHNVSESKNLGDITKIEIESLPNDLDLITHGSPCQDFSVAGKNAGGDKGSDTRSSLMWNTVEIVKHCRPKYVIWENVKNVLSKKHIHNFEAYLRALHELGYKSYHKVLNAKNYGVPQNRERIFVVSIREDLKQSFLFPNGWVLDKRIKDILEPIVDDKYYVSQEKTNQLIKNCGGKVDLSKQVVGTCHRRNDLSFATRDRVYSEENNAPTLSATMYKDAPKVVVKEEEPKINQVGLLDIKGNEQVRRVYGTNGISNTMQGGNRQPKIIEHKLVQSVKVRQYPVDKDALVDLLRTQKDLIGLSNKDIAEKLDVPITKVEHWFRRDNCFSIPDSQIWERLKEVLEITTTEFDRSITEFIDKPNTYDMSNRVYDEQGIAPTLTCTGEAGAKKILQGVELPCIGASRGRNPLNPSSRKTGDPTEQRLELNYNGTSNTLTPVKKDNLVIEPVVIVDENIKPSVKVNFEREKELIRKSDKDIYQCECTSGWQDNKVGINVTPTLRANNYNTHVYADFKIRKLTPLECWRLMGFPDSAFYKAQAVPTSNTQLYKQAGNSIVVPVLEAILKKLIK